MVSCYTRKRDVSSLTIFGNTGMRQIYNKTISSTVNSMVTYWYQQCRTLDFPWFITLGPQRNYNFITPCFFIISGIYFYYFPGLILNHGRHIKCHHEPPCNEHESSSLKKEIKMNVNLLPSHGGPLWTLLNKKLNRNLYSFSFTLKFGRFVFFVPFSSYH